MHVSRCLSWGSVFVSSNFQTPRTKHRQKKPTKQGKGCDHFVPLFPWGMPHGVVNMVFGTGAKAGEALVCHPEVPLISFTGSTLTAQRITEKSAPHCKKLSLELGGKNPAIVFDDADLSQCIPTTLRSSFANQVPLTSVLCICSRWFMCVWEWAHVSVLLNPNPKLSRAVSRFFVMSKPQVEKYENIVIIPQTEKQNNKVLFLGLSIRGNKVALSLSK